jgi:hypothetical protein
MLGLKEVARNESLSLLLTMEDRKLRESDGARQSGGGDRFRVISESLRTNVMTRLIPCPEKIILNPKMTKFHWLSKVVSSPRPVCIQR